MIVGLDYSTKRVDGAIRPLEGGNPGGWCHRSRPVTGHGGDEPLRVAAAGIAAWRVIRDLETAAAGRITMGDRVVWVAVERPGGGGDAGRATAEWFLPILGAITAQIVGLGLHVLWLPPSTWRKAIGTTGRAVNTKDGGNARTRELFPLAGDLDADALDALGIAEAGRLILLQRARARARQRAEAHNGAPV